MCYLGESLETVFLETLVRGNALRVVPRANLAARSVSTVVLRRELRLLQLQLHSEGLVLLDLDGAFPHMAEYDECHELTLEVLERRPEIDGIEYRSRWNDRLHCVALYDRAAESVEVVGSSKLVATWHQFDRFSDVTTSVLSELREAWINATVSGFPHSDTGSSSGDQPTGSHSHPVGSTRKSRIQVSSRSPTRRRSS